MSVLVEGTPEDRQAGQRIERIVFYHADEPVRADDALELKYDQLPGRWINVVQNIDGCDHVECASRVRDAVSRHDAVFKFRVALSGCFDGFFRNIHSANMRERVSEGAM